ncbi:hypothetical protein AB3R30_03740 [Leptolyngbyaceae cyanobacterium UHCC 1019]
MAQQNDLFTPLSTEASATVQGGWRGCRRSSRPFYYYSRPSYSRPSSSWGYGYGGWSGSGSSGAVTQTVNVNVLYND